MWSLSVICRHQVFALNFYLLRARRLLTVQKRYDQTSFWLAIDLICKFLLNVRPIEELWMWPCGNVNFSAVGNIHMEMAQTKSLLLDCSIIPHFINPPILLPKIAPSRALDLSPLFFSYWSPFTLSDTMQLKSNSIFFSLQIHENFRTLNCFFCLVGMRRGWRGIK